MSSITRRMFAMSALRAITTMLLMRLSARILTLSLLSAPRLLSAKVGLDPAGRKVLEGVVAGRFACVVRLRVVAAPLEAFWFWLFFDCEEDEAPMRLFSMDSTSSASAYLRRITSTSTSGVVSTSR